jgi:plasmid maintenance system antidote protein VapI
MWLNPGSSYDLSKARSKDIERQAREHQRQKEARAKGK